MMITHCCHAVNNHFKILEMLEMDKCVVSMFTTVRHSRSPGLSALWLNKTAILVQLHRQEGIGNERKERNREEEAQNKVQRGAKNGTSGKGWWWWSSQMNLTGRTFILCCCLPFNERIEENSLSCFLQFPLILHLFSRHLSYFCVNLQKSMFFPTLWCKQIWITSIREIIPPSPKVCILHWN